VIINPGYKATETRRRSPGLTLKPVYNARWISRDPIAEKGGLNLYGYVGSDPINARDLFGLEVRAYNYPAFGIPNTNHDFFWSTTENNGVGRNGKSGSAVGNGIPVDFWVGSPNFSNYTVVHLPDGMSDAQFLEHVKNDPNLNGGPFIPYINDCHNSLMNTAQDAGATVQDPAPRIDWLGVLGSYLENSFGSMFGGDDY
jgi:uncharacterized protein RhaS with RHS repeats